MLIIVIGGLASFIILKDKFINSNEVEKPNKEYKSDYKLYDMTILVENNEILRKFIIDLENLPFVLKVERMIN